jgi:hypothetical protein
VKIFSDKDNKLIEQAAISVLSSCYETIGYTVKYKSKNLSIFFFFFLQETSVTFSWVTILPKQGLSLKLHFVHCAIKIQATDEQSLGNNSSVHLL